VAVALPALANGHDTSHTEPHVLAIFTVVLSVTYSTTTTAWLRREGGGRHFFINRS
jgi:hypothetical protein